MSDACRDERGTLLRSTSVDQQQAVDALASGDAERVAEVARIYGDHLYDYCYTLVGDVDEATDAVHDALLVAVNRVSRLRDKSSVLAWLYALARNEALRRQRGRGGGGGAGLPEVVPPPGLPRLALQAWEAVSLLAPTDRELMVLSVRHGLRKEELAKMFHTTGWSMGRQLEHAREHLAAAWRAMSLASDPQYSCDGLATALSGWNEVFTPLVRRRVEAHVESCQRCQEKQLEPSAVNSYGAVPLSLAPMSLARRVVESLDQPEKLAYRGSQAGPFSWSGFPARLDGEKDSRTRMAWLAAAAALVLLVGGGGYWLFANNDDTLRGADRSTIETQVDDSTGDEIDNPEPGLTSPASQSPSRGASPSPSRSATHPPTTRPSSPHRNTTVPPANSTPPTQPGGGSTSSPPTSTPVGSISATLQNQSSCRRWRWRALVKVQVNNANATSVTVSWESERGDSDTVNADSVGGGQYQVTLELPGSQKISWSAQARTDAKTLATSTYSAYQDCNY